ncbi:MAG: ABC-2 type transport system ATP-binding protein [Pseudohongiellaceae bacterium]|jgi:ABC-2 type transport system ATP-binding protein
MIVIDGLVKSYGELRAVNQLSLQVQPGEIFGLLGPNGAGKTSTIGCLCGLVTPDVGSVSVLGANVVTEPLAARRALGVVPQDLALYTDLGARENLIFWAKLHGLRGTDLSERVDQVLRLVGLEDRAKEPAEQLSGGMQRRLNFGCGIVHRPKVLLLDEPTVGVDPQSRVALLELVRAQADEGTTVLYTTHYMDEAESLCDRLAIMDHGRIVAAGTLAELRDELGDSDRLRLAGQFAPEAVRQALAGFEGLELLSVSVESVSLTVLGAGRRLPEIWSALQSAGAEIRETTMTQPSLESLFIELTGRELR